MSISETKVLTFTLWVFPGQSALAGTSAQPRAMQMAVSITAPVCALLVPQHRRCFKEGVRV